MTNYERQKKCLAAFKLRDPEGFKKWLHNKNSKAHAKRRASDPEFVETNRQRSAAFQKNNPEYNRINKRLRRYGITAETRNKMLAGQGNCCAVCKTTDPGKRDWHTDHDHDYEKKTGEILVRGFLCHNCNCLLGFANDNEGTLLSAIEYLQKHKHLGLANMANKPNAEQDKLIVLTVAESDPYRIKGSDFPNHGGTGQGPKVGHDDLLSESELQVGPRHNEDGGAGEGGYGTPTQWNSGGRSPKVSAGFPVSKNKGEGEDAPSAVSIPCGVDLMTGKLTCTGYTETPVDEVPQANVSIGRH